MRASGPETADPLYASTEHRGRDGVAEQGESGYVMISTAYLHSTFLQTRTRRCRALVAPTSVEPPRLAGRTLGDTVIGIPRCRSPTRPATRDYNAGDGDRLCVHRGGL